MSSPSKNPKKADTPSPEKNDNRPKGPPGPFDVSTVEALVGLMTQHDLREIDLRDGDQRLRLRRGVEIVAATHAAPMHAPAVAPAATAGPARAEAPAAPAAPAKKLVDIKSPTPGTFYAAAKPGEPPFVKVGTKVSPETVVCLIEAMKIFNEIQAECSGVIVESLVDNQQPVEFGQVLYKVDPAG